MKRGATVVRSLVSPRRDQAWAWSLLAAMLLAGLAVAVLVGDARAPGFSDVFSSKERSISGDDEPRSRVTNRFADVLDFEQAAAATVRTDARAGRSVSTSRRTTVRRSSPRTVVAPKPGATRPVPGGGPTTAPAPTSGGGTPATPAPAAPPTNPGGIATPNAPDPKPATPTPVVTPPVVSTPSGGGATVTVPVGSDGGITAGVTPGGAGVNVTAPSLGPVASRELLDLQVDQSDLTTSLLGIATLQLGGSTS